MNDYTHPSSSYARILFRHLRLSEENCDAYFQGTNVSYQEMMTLDGTIPREDFVRIYRNALAISDRADLGLSVGSQLHLSTHGPLGVATFSGPDLRTALILLAKYSQTRTEFFEVTVSEYAQGIRILFDEAFDLGDLRAFITESVLSGLFSAINFFLGGEPFTGRVNLSYKAPSYGGKYVDHFGENIAFNQPVTEVLIPEADLSAPSPTADPALHRESVAICERQLKDIMAGASTHHSSSTREAVSRLIVENPGKLWTLNEVAAKLHVSPRTLIRKLESEGTRFQVVRDELAKNQVANYLKDPGLSVESIGHLMGFSEASSFRRSFKRWFGETPSQYIARVRGTTNR